MSIFISNLAVFDIRIIMKSPQNPHLKENKNKKTWFYVFLKKKKKSYMWSQDYLSGVNYHPITNWVSLKDLGFN